MNDSIGNPQLIRSINEKLVLELTIRNRGLSRAEISRLTGLSKPTVSSSVKNLLDLGLVREIGPGGTGYGRKPTLVDFISSYYYVCGIEIGAVLVRLVVADLSGEIVARKEIPMPQQVLKPESLLRFLRDETEALLGHKGITWEKVKCIAFGIPAVVNELGEASMIVSNLQGLDPFFSRNKLSEWFPCDILLENDVNLAALAEYERGAARDKDVFAYLSVDAGVGAGVMVRGQLLRGLGGVAGEFGDMTTGQGRRLEDCISEKGLLELAQRILEEDKTESTLRGVTLNLDVLFSAVNEGDSVARKIFVIYIRDVAYGLHSLFTVLAPQLIILGGRIGEQPYVLRLLQQHIAEYFAVKPQLESASLGRESVLVGAVQTAVAHTIEYIKENIISS
ncbi:MULTISPECIES: ROK family transcriptional regulator [Cohnella]|uniref:ROK family transcriptional regulator n=1 Tax=Cohnella TaxID=329857 RepID=UPI0009B9597E|nr:MULTISPECIES: ROK family transcriptional regulator [Cohnella]MBN2984933.1 ROK family transcriptional regulator [Cohnella algarum]